ncbi:hypothetical protein ACEWY4_021635 [Coilia grayii]|uniref:THAP-type domain-containing protein n=1 Tax=Coilia grayii TaxID=363190 RepID=A0ABD1J3P6_9TELE
MSESLSRPFKRGTMCCAYGCKKRKKQKDSLDGRSNSEGSEDEESIMKRRQPRTFHTFPRDTERRNVWLVYLHRQNFEPTRHSRVCSDHFTEADIDRTGQNIRLQDDATPTRIKNLPKHIRKAVTKQQKKAAKQKKEPPCLKNSESKDVEEPEELENSSPKCIEVSIPTLAYCGDDQQDSQVTPQRLGLQNSDHQYYRHAETVDHEYCIKDPKLFVRKLHKSHEKITVLKKKLKYYQQRSRRLQQQVTSLKDVVENLRQKQTQLQQEISSQDSSSVKTGRKAKQKTICDIPSKSGEKKDD